MMGLFDLLAEVEEVNVIFSFYAPRTNPIDYVFHMKRRRLLNFKIYMGQEFFFSQVILFVHLCSIISLSKCQMGII